METKSNELLSKDEKYIWHAMRRHNPGASSMVVTEADGAWIKDINGNEYLDGMSGLWCVNVGYGREERSEEHTSELQSRGHLVCRLLLEKKKKQSDEDSY